MFYRTPFLRNTSGRLLLIFLLWKAKNYFYFFSVLRQQICLEVSMGVVWQGLKALKHLMQTGTSLYQISISICVSVFRVFITPSDHTLTVAEWLRVRFHFTDPCQIMGYTTFQIWDFADRLYILKQLGSATFSQVKRSVNKRISCFLFPLFGWGRIK